MTLCEPCKNLDKQPSNAPPHPALELTKSEDWGRTSGGMAKGQANYYRCRTCGATLVQDRDVKDKNAIWEVTREA